VFKNISYICLFMILWIYFCFDVGADPLPKAVNLPSASVAVKDDSMATVTNPAGLGIANGFNLSYFHTLSGVTGGDNAFFLSTKGAGFGAEFVDQKMEFTKYTLSDGSKLADGIYLGTSYSWFSSKDKKYDKLSSWDIGLLCRPANSLSFGLVTRNLNHPSFDGVRTDRIYDVAVAIRPYTNRITLSWNSSLQEGKNLKDSDYNVALDFEPIDGLLLRGCYFRDHSFEVSIGMGLPKFDIGTYRRFDENRNGLGGGIYTQFSSEWRRSKLQASNYILEMDTMDANLLIKAQKDDTIDGIVFKPDEGDYSMGVAQEMRDAISDFRSAGKKAICYMETAGNKEYYVASACDKLYLNPAGSLAFYGLRSEVTSYKGLLDKLGVRADLYRIGKYKSASEMLTNESMSDGTRESLNFILDDLHDQFVNGIAESRKVNTDRVQDWIDSGPYTAKEAKKAELVDDLIYSDQINDTVKQVMGRRVMKLTSEEYASRRYHHYDWREKPRIAVIYASGMMLAGRSMSPSIMGSDTISEAIKEARMDDSIKAIVLRIDSGGGAVFASDLIWREVMLAKGKKPFIVSMGDVAASGGYYIACPADAIVAEPGTITGSIGIITGKISVRSLYDKLGIRKETIKKGKNSDIYSSYEGFTDEQIEIIERQMNELYQTFVSKVADGRKMKEETVDSIAQGRVWTGRQAQKNGLVDRLGGLQLAMSIAKEKAKLKDKTPEIIEFPKQDSLWRILTMGNTSLLNDIRSLLYFLKMEDVISHDNFYFLMPYIDYE
jgi:protease IV